MSERASTRTSSSLFSIFRRSVSVSTSASVGATDGVCLSRLLEQDMIGPFASRTAAHRLGLPINLHMSYDDHETYTSCGHID